MNQLFRLRSLSLGRADKAHITAKRFYFFYPNSYAILRCSNIEAFQTFFSSLQRSGNCIESSLTFITPQVQSSCVFQFAENLLTAARSISFCLLPLLFLNDFLNRRLFSARLLSILATNYRLMR